MNAHEREISSGLTGNGDAILKALLRADIAWQPPEALAEALETTLDEISDGLAILDLGGWLAVWERPEGTCVTLSTLGAERLGARLVEVGPEETPRWALNGEPDPLPPRARNVCSSVRAATLEFLIDPHPTPAEALELAETPSRRPRPRAGQPADAAGDTEIDRLPLPTLLLGVGLTPWPGPSGGSRTGCPACGLQPLGPQTYCLLCDRWGLDHRLGSNPSRREPGTQAPRTPSPVEVQGQRAATKARRKARRAARHQAQEQAHRPRTPRSAA